MNEAIIQEFENNLDESTQNDTFVRMIFSGPVDKKGELIKVSIRPIVLKSQIVFNFHTTNKTNDSSRNFDSITQWRQLLGKFRFVNLFTTNRDFELKFSSKGKVKLINRKPTFHDVTNKKHDQIKKYLIDTKAPFLFELGITNKEGVIQKGRGDKHRQIQKFIEIIDKLLPENSNKGIHKILDMGCGKGYLTFAMANYLKNNKKNNYIVEGVEIRKGLVEKTNRIVKKLKYKNLEFKLGEINAFNFEKISVLIALHACNTATDDAIYKGIKADADLIIVSPCCHKQVRKVMDKNNLNKVLIRHGIIKERLAEIITDATRALVLEYAGYKSRVIEFISTEHTGKNLMIIAEKSDNPRDKDLVKKEIKELLVDFGVKKQYLADLVVV